MLTALVTGNMIGSGIFLLPASLASIGSISLLSWCLTATGALVLAFIFAQMSTRLPIQSGGPYLFVLKTLGQFLGFQTALNYWIAIWIGNAAVAIATVGYLSFFFPHLSPTWTAIGIIWGLTIINLMGIRLSGWVQLLTTILKLIPLAMIILLGWQYFHADFLTQSFNVSGKSHFSALSMGAALTLWAFTGLESATVPAELSENPNRNIPLATIIGTLITVLVYVLSSLLIMGMIPNATLAHSEAPFTDAAVIILGHWGGVLIALGAVISCVGSLNGWIMLQGQISRAAALDGLFPALFKKESRRGTPSNALIISSILVTLILFMSASDSIVGQFNILILLANFAFLLPYFYTSVSHWMTREANNWKMILPFSGMGYSLWMLESTGHQAIAYGGLLILVSVPLYAFICTRRT